MKGIILAGGTGTRLYPLTKLMNKHLLPVGRHPMASYGIERLRAAGITEIIMVIGKMSASLFTEYYGSGRSYGVHLTFAIQEEAGASPKHSRWRSRILLQERNSSYCSAIIYSGTIWPRMQRHSAIRGLARHAFCCVKCPTRSDTECLSSTAPIRSGSSALKRSRSIRHHRIASRAFTCMIQMSFSILRRLHHPSAGN